MSRPGISALRAAGLRPGTYIGMVLGSRRLLVCVDFILVKREGPVKHAQVLRQANELNILTTGKCHTGRDFFRFWRLVRGGGAFSAVDCENLCRYKQTE